MLSNILFVHGLTLIFSLSREWKWCRCSLNHGKTRRRPLGTEWQESLDYQWVWIRGQRGLCYHRQITQTQGKCEGRKLVTLTAGLVLHCCKDLIKGTLCKENFKLSWNISRGTKVMTWGMEEFASVASMNYQVLNPTPAFSYFKS